MSEVLIPAAEAGVSGNPPAFDRKAAMRSVALSLFVNGVLPFLIYKLLVPYFPAGSVMPYICASAFPTLGLAVGYVRTRTVDFIAIIALFGILYSVASTFLAGQVRLGMIFGATQAFLIAAAFFVSALIGRPIIFFIARQFAAGNHPTQRANFSRVNEADGRRTCTIATIVWAVGILGLGCASLALAMTLQPATYLLVNNIINTAVNVLLVVWTIRFVPARLMAVGARLAARTTAG